MLLLLLRGLLLVGVRVPLFRTELADIPHRVVGTKHRNSARRHVAISNGLDFLNAVFLCVHERGRERDRAADVVRYC